MSIVALHRYYIWANRMRTEFDNIIAQGLAVASFKNHALVSDTFIFMSYWYAALYVVVEGWQELNLADGRIEKLLESPNLSLLRRYRNGVAHFQKNYHDERFFELIKQGQSSVAWVRELHAELGRYFLEAMKIP